MTPVRLFRAVTSFIVGFSIGYAAVYVAELLNISPLLTAIPAMALSILWVAFISEVNF